MAQVQLKGKLLITAELTLTSGLHIGDSSDFAPIGAVDRPFIRDPLTKKPIIPGSSIKGKLRTLLAKVRDGSIALPKPEEDEEVVARLFGKSGAKESQPSRLQFFDLFVNDASVAQFDTRDTDTYLGEVKSENEIVRLTGVANPRQIERVPAGMKFDFKLVYNIENEEEKEEDLKVLIAGFRLLQLDYIGGHGSRGYGRIALSKFKVQTLNVEDMTLAEDADMSEKMKEACL